MEFKSDDVFFQLVPIQQYDTLPRYYIYAGLVFIPLSQVSLNIEVMRA